MFAACWSCRDSSASLRNDEAVSLGYGGDAGLAAAIWLDETLCARARSMAAMRANVPAMFGIDRTRNGRYTVLGGESVVAICNAVAGTSDSMGPLMPLETIKPCVHDTDRWARCLGVSEGCAALKKHEMGSIQ